MTNSPFTFETAATQVVEMARFAGARGWVPATAGNFSVRMDGARAALTASGGDKGQLDASGVIEVEIDGAKHPRASAEGPLHLCRYAAVPEIGAIAHCHPLAATVLSRRYEKAEMLILEGWELQKAFAGETTHDRALEVLVVPNDQDTVRLAKLVEECLPKKASAPGYLIAGHGLYTWGRNAAAAKRHMEAFDHLLTAKLYEESLK